MLEFASGPTGASRMIDICCRGLLLRSVAEILPALGRRTMMASTVGCMTAAARRSCRSVSDAAPAVRELDPLAPCPPRSSNACARGLPLCGSRGTGSSTRDEPRSPKLSHRRATRRRLAAHPLAIGSYRPEQDVCGGGENCLRHDRPGRPATRGWQRFLHDAAAYADLSTSS